MNPTEQYDVIILGLGGMGSAAAAQLAARGKKVLGLEKFSPAHNQGSSHGGSRIIRQAYFEDPAYVPLLLRAYELWADLARSSGNPVYQITGGLYMGPADSDTFAGSLSAAQTWDLPHEILTPIEVQHRFPLFRLEPDVLTVYEELGGFARPELTVSSYLYLTGQSGADLRFNSTVLDWSATNSSVTVTTAEGCFSAESLVITPGAWTPHILQDLQLPIAIERHVLYWFDAPQGIAPYADNPIYIHDTSSTDHHNQIYGFPAIDGPQGGVKVAFFRRGISTTADTIDREVYPAEITTMQERVTQLLPGMNGELRHSATCMYSVTPDENFIIGTHPEYQQVAIACGFSGHGFKFVPVVGEILADLVCQGKTAHPIELFQPQRFTLSV